MNKKSILDQLENKNILIRKRNKIYLNFDSFGPFEIKEVSLKNKEENVLILKSNNIVFEYWTRQDLLIPPWKTHWFQLKDGFLLKLKNNSLNNLLKKGINKAGNLNKLCKNLNMSTPSFYNLLNKRMNMVSVKKLKRLLTYLNIQFIKLNKKIEYTKKGIKVSIESPQFPINLNSKYGAFILGAIMSDGCIYIDKKARDTVRTKYSTSEIESIDSFISFIYKIYGKVHIQKERIRNCEIIRIGSSIIGDTLLKAGAALGHKAKTDADIPWMIRIGSKELKINYLKAAFDDEASIYIGKKLYKSYIVLSRYKHLKLNSNQKERLSKLKKYMSKRKFPTGHINMRVNIKKALELTGDDLKPLLNSVPKLMLGESKILRDFNIEHRIWNSSLNITSLGNYSLCCDLFINKKDSLLKFYKEIGFSLVNKQEKLSKIIKERR